MKKRAGMAGNEIRATGDTAELQKVRSFVEEHARAFGFSEEETGKIVLAVDEACSNIIRHSYHHNPRKEFFVRIRTNGREFGVDIMDAGDSFDPLGVTSPDMKEYFSEHRSGGLGIHIMRMVMDTIDYTPASEAGAFNRLSLSKKLH